MRIGRDSDSEWPAPLWLTSGATTQTSLGELARDLDQRLQPRRMDAVVVGDEDARLGDIVDFHLRALGPGMISRPPI